MKPVDFLLPAVLLWLHHNCITSTTTIEIDVELDMANSLLRCISTASTCRLRLQTTDESTRVGQEINRSKKRCSDVLSQQLMDIQHQVSDACIQWESISHCFGRKKRARREQAVQIHQHDTTTIGVRVSLQSTSWPNRLAPTVVVVVES